MQKANRALSPKQQEILENIKAYMFKRQYPPTVREIADMSGLASSSSVFFYLRELEDAGKIKIREKSPRAIEVTGMHYVFGQDLKHAHMDPGTGTGPAEERNCNR